MAVCLLVGAACVASAGHVAPFGAASPEGPVERPVQGSETPSAVGADPSDGTAAPSNPGSATSLDGLDGSVVLGQDVTKPAQSWKKPRLGRSYQDPAYGTTVTRVSDSGADRFNRNTYSRRQAENADGSMFLTYHGSATYHVYKTSNHRLVTALDIHPDAEPQWHPENPNVLRHIGGPNSSVGSLKLFEIDVASNDRRELADLTKRVTAALPTARYMYDRAEGSPSADGNRFAWMVFDQEENPLGIVSYDLQLDRVLGTTRLAPEQNVDWVSASPSGEYVIASSTQGTFVFDVDLTNRRLLTEAIEHSDIGYDSDGREAYVYIDFNSVSATAGWLTSVDLETLERTKIFDIYDQANSSVHISMKGYDKPGWALISTYSCKVPGAWTCDKIFAVELEPNGRIVNLAHTYNCGQNYWTETQAVVNRSFTQVYFNSDAGSCETDAEVYKLEVPVFS